MYKQVFVVDVVEVISVPCGGSRGALGVQLNPPLAHSLVWKILIWTFTFAQKYLSGNLRTPARTPLHRILDPPQCTHMYHYCNDRTEDSIIVNGIIDVNLIWIKQLPTPYQHLTMMKNPIFLFLCIYNLEVLNCKLFIKILMISPIILA